MPHCTVDKSLRWYSNVGAGYRQAVHTPSNDHIYREPARSHSHSQQTMTNTIAACHDHCRLSKKTQNKINPNHHVAIPFIKNSSIQPAITASNITNPNI